MEELARHLVQRGVQPWLDEWNLIPGKPWEEAIEVALGRCASCVVCVGPTGTGPWQNEDAGSYPIAACARVRAACE